MNSLSRNGIIKLGGEKKKEKKPSTHPHKKKTKIKPQHFLYLFLSTMPGWRHWSWNMLEVIACVRHKVQGGVSWPAQHWPQLAPASAEPTSTAVKKPTGCQREASLLKSFEERHQPPRRAGDSLFKGGSSLPQPSPAEEVGRRGHNLQPMGTSHHWVRDTLRGCVLELQETHTKQQTPLHETAWSCCSPSHLPG